jgi:hypothetical protein
MYRCEHRDQLSFEDFFLPFAGRLSGDHCWIKLADLIPWDDLEDEYASQFCKGFGACLASIPLAAGGAESVLGVLEGDALDRAGQDLGGLGGVVRHSGGLASDRLNFTAFYEALLEARGIHLGPARGDGTPGRKLSY